MQASHKKATSMPASSSTRPATTTRCAKPPSALPSSGRRAALLSVGTALLIAQRPDFARADTCANIELDANARRLRGERDLEEEAYALECRRRDITPQLEASGYEKAAGRKTAGPAPNVPVAELNSEYAQQTLALADQIEKYMDLDVYDKSRVPLIKDMKVKCSDWVSKYARGGSARSQSARKMYVAVDAVTGFLASNGLAPLPNRKKEATKKSLDEARAFLAKGI
mmetsp:Transcript_5623/g.13233  ORF Transcript_5623/g.13233 Transcript_5623/m.13233 type:complete len:226 (+) Transcript_5623:151-828(+)|eukprot:CAMPEP_0202358370 /NCGR_PEP_ID=MMETSP1126-20121109/12060_1 /ASSEMBLY_ACC=CAM_ASM_000457 /TAXON_ID=3047 /ORGANISM="Dunaliella tertiolecta, Strain CCMP1320" /LENGTH=225 /DNA_ID=CAMNT_0048951509 /DNA_START=72 /DNA_END=749 /DNA_ORIENTATION=+